MLLRWLSKDQKRMLDAPLTWVLASRSGGGEMSEESFRAGAGKERIVDCDIIFAHR